MNGPQKDPGLDNSRTLADLAEYVKETNRLARDNNDYRAQNAVVATQTGTSVAMVPIGGTVLYTHAGLQKVFASDGTVLTWTGTNIAGFDAHKGLFNKAVFELTAAGVGTMTVGSEAPLAALVTIAEPTNTAVFTAVNTTGTLLFIGSTTATTNLTFADVAGGRDSAALPTVSPAAYNTPTSWVGTTVYAIGDIRMTPLTYTGTVLGSQNSFIVTAVTGASPTSAAGTGVHFTTSTTALTDGSVTWLKHTAPLSNVKLARTATYTIGGKTYTKAATFNLWKMTGFNVPVNYTAKFALCLDTAGNPSVVGSYHDGSNYGAAAYSAGTTYAQGDVVRSNSAFYKSKVGTNLANTPASSNHYWEFLTTDMPETLGGTACIAVLQIAPTGAAYTGGATPLCDATAVPVGTFLDIRRLSPFAS